MLVLSRKLGERIRIGKDLSLVVLGIKAGRVRIGIVAPKSIPIVRGEIPLLESELSYTASTYQDHCDAADFAPTPRQDRPPIGPVHSAENAIYARATREPYRPSVDRD